MKLICICGAKNSKKDLLAMKLASNSDCVWIHPYTDIDVPVNQEDFELDEFIHLNKKQLSDKMDKEVPLAVVELNGARYVFFETQLRADFVVLIGDDRVVTHLKNHWRGNLLTIKCHSSTEKYSDRNLLTDDEFDVVFDYDSDDIDLLMYKIEDIYDYEVK